MKQKLVAGFALLLMLTGFAILLFPTISQAVYRSEARGVMQEYAEWVKKTPEDTRENLYLAMQQYNRALYETHPQSLKDPFVFQQAGFTLADLGFEKDMIGYIRIPDMSAELPVYLGASAQNLKKGAAQLSGTSLPVGGTNTNTVIAAHRGYSRAAMFRDIEDLHIGSDVFFVNFRETLVYRVVEIKVISPYEVESVFIQKDRDLLTLITCHPYGSNTSRYAVYCERITG